MSIEELQQKNLALLHAMQSGVAFTMPSKEVEPKHLRTGINHAMCQLGALAELLIKKNIFTEEEYWTTINEYLERDVKSYQDLLGSNVTLH